MMNYILPEIVENIRHIWLSKNKALKNLPEPSQELFE